MKRLRHSIVVFMPCLSLTAFKSEQTLQADLSVPTAEPGISLSKYYSLYETLVLHGRTAFSSKSYKNPVKHPGNPGAYRNCRPGLSGYSLFCCAGGYVANS